MKNLILLSALFIGGITKAQDMEKLLTKPEWQLCEITKEFKDIKELKLLNGEDPCGTWDSESIDRVVKFKTTDNRIAFNETKMTDSGIEEAKGTVGTWKFNEKKMTIKFTYDKGVAALFKIEELTEERLILKKM